MKKNRCSHLMPESMPLLPSEDSWKKMYEAQAILQERLGRSALSRSSDMQKKCLMIMEEIYHINAEFAEMMDRLPYKHWKKYEGRQKEDWESEDQRTETLFEYVDALHFFMNIGLILGFSLEEVFYYYECKNKENHGRQDRNY